LQAIRSARLGRARSQPTSAGGGVPCLIFIGSADADFLEGARRAPAEIPDAELLVLDAADH
jgi:hypothetical protein